MVSTMVVFETIVSSALLRAGGIIKGIAGIPHIKKLVPFLNLVGYRVSSALDVLKPCFK